VDDAVTVKMKLHFPPPTVLECAPAGTSVSSTTMLGPIRCPTIVLASSLITRSNEAHRLNANWALIAPAGKIMAKALLSR
jgi:hypothetical protein